MKKNLYCPCCFSPLTSNEICPGPYDCPNHGKIVHVPSWLTEEQAHRLREKTIYAIDEAEGECDAFHLLCRAFAIGIIILMLWALYKQITHT